MSKYIKLILHLKHKCMCSTFQFTQSRMYAKICALIFEWLSGERREVRDYRRFSWRTFLPCLRMPCNQIPSLIFPLPSASSYKTLFFFDDWFRNKKGNSRVCAKQYFYEIFLITSEIIFLRWKEKKSLNKKHLIKADFRREEKNCTRKIKKNKIITN